jgi:hypothetical protein
VEHPCGEPRSPTASDDHRGIGLPHGSFAPFISTLQDIRGQGVRCRRDPFSEESYRAEPPDEPKAGW